MVKEEKRKKRKEEKRKKIKEEKRKKRKEEKRKKGKGRRGKNELPSPRACVGEKTGFWRSYG